MQARKWGKPRCTGRAPMFDAVCRWPSCADLLLSVHPLADFVLMPRLPLGRRPGRELIGIQ
eukprot:scaffold2594_cov19-Tisochrysis_lutea.AAC.1